MGPLASASWQASRFFQRRSLALDSAVRCVSKGAPRLIAAPVRHDCGDDAFFLATVDRMTTVGIADGVGSWARYGINPALFAWELMVHCEAAALAGASDPMSVLTRGYETTVRDGSASLIGSSTACIASLDCSSGRLRVANLGDSGAVLVRNGGMLLETKEQQHYFNCPYQLACVPKGMDGRGDLPASSQEYEAQAQAGDLLVLATDGFFDNVWRETLLNVLVAMCDKPPAEIAQALVELAHRAAHSTQQSPFSFAANQNGIRHGGGKPDDIAVFVARVVLKAQ